MRKRVFGKKLSRGRGARRALFRSLIRALVSHGKIKTTKAKATSIQGHIDSLITIAKEDSVVARRKTLAILGNDRETTEKIFKEITPALGTRSGGFTRLIPLPARRGDAAEMVRLEWVEEIVTGGQKQVPTKKKGKETEYKDAKKRRIKLPQRKVSKKKESNKK